MDPRKFSLRFMKIKGKIVLDTKNTQNFRLRRAKNTVSVSISVQNEPFSVKIAPEGRENFLEVKNLHLVKSKKNTALDHPRVLTHRIPIRVGEVQCCAFRKSFNVGIPGKYLSLLGLVAQPELSKDFLAAIALTHGTELGERMRISKLQLASFHPDSERLWRKTTIRTGTVSNLGINCNE